MILIWTPISNFPSSIFKLYGPFQAQQLQLASPLLDCFTDLFVLRQSQVVSLFVFIDFHSVFRRDGKVIYSASSRLFLNYFLVGIYQSLGDCTERTNLLAVIRCYLFIIILQVFHISVSRRFSTGVWVRASLPKSPRTLFSILIDFNPVVFKWSSLALLFASVPVHAPIFWWPFQVHQLQLVSPSLLCSTVFQFSTKV